MKIAAALLACAGMAWLFAAVPAQAQDGVTKRTVSRVAVHRPRTRITVRRERSYLDPGPQVQPYSQHYTDYLFPNQSPMDVLGPGQTNDRRPFPYVWEPGGSWRIP